MIQPYEHLPAHPAPQQQMITITPPGHVHTPACFGQRSGYGLGICDPVLDIPPCPTGPLHVAEIS